MPIDVIMPRLGLTMEVGTVQRWLAVPGEHLEAGQPLLEVETDKVVVEVEAPASGVLGALLVAEGESVPIGALLARVYAPREQPGEPAEDKETSSGRRETAIDQHRQPIRQGPEQDTGASQFARPAAPGTRNLGEQTLAPVAEGAPLAGRIFSSPRARKQAREANLDWRLIPGSGPKGRVIERDVLRAVGMRAPTTGERATATDYEPASVAYQPSSGPHMSQLRPDLGHEVAPHDWASTDRGALTFHLGGEALAGSLLDLRERLLAPIERRVGHQLGIADLLVKIVAKALAEHPRAGVFWNPGEKQPGSLRDGRTAPPQHVHIGIAVITEGRTAVAVLRDADVLGLAQIAVERARLVEGVRQGNLPPGDLEGGTFTLIDLGEHRLDTLQAVLHPPQIAVLAAGQIVERPTLGANRLSVRPTMGLTLSCDSRVLDVAYGMQLLNRVVELIEEPWGLLA